VVHQRVIGVSERWNCRYARNIPMHGIDVNNVWFIISASRRFGVADESA